MRISQIGVRCFALLDARARDGRPTCIAHASCVHIGSSDIAEPSVMSADSKGRCSICRDKPGGLWGSFRRWYLRLNDTESAVLGSIICAAHLRRADRHMSILHRARHPCNTGRGAARPLPSSSPRASKGTATITASASVSMRIIISSGRAPWACCVVLIAARSGDHRIPCAAACRIWGVPVLVFTSGQWQAGPQRGSANPGPNRCLTCMRASMACPTLPRRRVVGKRNTAAERMR